MIVTEEGKNIYPEDIETVFESLAVKEFCVFRRQLHLAKAFNGGRKNLYSYSISSRGRNTVKNSGRTSTRATIAC